MKRYVVFWGDGYRDAPLMEIHDEAFFCEDHGYDESNIKRVEELWVGLWCKIEDGHAEQYVIRIDD